MTCCVLIWKARWCGKIQVSRLWLDLWLTHLDCGVWRAFWSVNLDVKSVINLRLENIAIMAQEKSTSERPRKMSRLPKGQSVDFSTYSQPTDTVQTTK